MKLTWFGGTTIRVHVGGTILVVDADSAPRSVDRGELLSGADRVFGLADDPALALIDLDTWRPRPPRRPIEDSGDVVPVEVFRTWQGAVLIAAAGESPLMLFGADPAPEFGRWADGGFFVFFDSTSLEADATRLLEAARPRLIALATGEQEAEPVIAALRHRLGGAALIALEPALALEV